MEAKNKRQHRGYSKSLKQLSTKVSQRRININGQRRSKFCGSVRASGSGTSDKEDLTEEVGQNQANSQKTAKPWTRFYWERKKREDQATLWSEGGKAKY